MWLDATADHLGWPTPDDIFRASAGGQGVYRRLVQAKIGRPLARLCPGFEVRAGALMPDPDADSFENPVAIVCEFAHPVADAVLAEAQRLAWNFSGSALLVTLEPHRLQAWSCSMAPHASSMVADRRILPPIEIDDPGDAATALKSDIAQQLHWVALVTGTFFKEHRAFFRPGERADALLVANLRFVRKQLLELGLSSKEHCHSLLARLIFTQFLFQRLDSDGRPALSEAICKGRFDGNLQHVHTGLESILKSKEETYALFHWLDHKFNGDLFPGKGGDDNDSARAWREEKEAVRRKHLALLREFVSGALVMENGQQTLWPMYSFDTLPLEFVSSVYEEFLNEEQEEPAPTTRRPSSGCDSDILVDFLQRDRHFPITAPHREAAHQSYQSFG